MTRAISMSATLRIVAVVAAILFAALLLAGRPAYALSAEPPVGPTDVAVPTAAPDEPDPQPNPDLPPGPDDFKPNEPNEPPCNPAVLNCDDPEICWESPEEGCGTGEPGGKVPTPERIDTGAGGAAGGARGGLIVAAAALVALAAGVAWRALSVRTGREQR